MNKIRPRCAVLLSGCGFRDGTEIQEAAAVLFHASRLNLRTTVFAPNKQQQMVIDHSTLTVSETESRSILAESARISRTVPLGLSDLRVERQDLLVIPGGMGAGQNLSTFSLRGQKNGPILDQGTGRVMKEFMLYKKRIGLVCLSPVLALMAPPTKSRLELTFGKEVPDDSEIFKLAKEKNAKLFACNSAERFHCDSANRVWSTPAYMLDDATPWAIFTGVGRMMDDMVKSFEEEITSKEKASKMASVADKK